MGLFENPPDKEATNSFLKLSNPSDILVLALEILIQMIQRMLLLSDAKSPNLVIGTLLQSVAHLEHTRNSPESSKLEVPISKLPHVRLGASPKHLKANSTIRWCSLEMLKVKEDEKR